MRMDLAYARSIEEVLDFIHGEGEIGFNRFSTLSSRAVGRIIYLAGGFWQHNGDPKAPHAILRSGKHSDGFIAVTAALNYVAINDLFATLLAHKINRQNWHQIDWIVGSDHAAATFSYAVAHRLAIQWNNRELKHDFTEKVVAYAEETQKWTRHTIGKAEQVLQVEELCTTNLTLQRVREGLANAHPDYPINYAPIIGMAVNRTGNNSFEGSRIVSLLDITFHEWPLYECPLCAGGSEPLQHVKKDAATWATLTGRPTV